MDDENLSILQTAETKYVLPVQYTCDSCGFTSLQGFQECPQCIHGEKPETKKDIVGEGKWLIILGTIYGIISLVILLNSGGNFRFFQKASETDFMSVSNFVALFAFPLILIPTGIITLIRKKDNWKARLIIIFIIGVAIFTLDQVLMRIF